MSSDIRSAQDEEFQYEDLPVTQELHFSDSEYVDDGAEDHVGDYSTRLDELMDDDPADGSNKGGDSDEEIFVYDGADATQDSTQYHDRLREVLGAEAEEGSEPILNMEPLGIKTTPPDDEPFPSDTPREGVPSLSSVDPRTPPRIHSPAPNEFSRIDRPFPHPHVSRLRSFTPQGSRASSNGGLDPNHSHAFEGTSPSPSHFSSMSRMSSHSNLVGFMSSFHAAKATAPPVHKEVIKWTELKHISQHVYSSKAHQKASSILGVPSLGSPTVLAANGFICIGSDEGCVFIYDFKQSLKYICGTGGSGNTVGAVTALALSHDHTYVASGHAMGHIQLFELKNPHHPVRHVPPTTLPVVMSGRKEGHLYGSRIVNVGFVAGRHTAIISADEHGLAFYHSLGKMLFVEASDILRILGRYPDVEPSRRTGTPNFVLGRHRKSRYSVLSMGPLPLGTTPHPTDHYNIIALLTPLKLVIVGLKPSPRTWFKYPRQQEESISWDRRYRGTGNISWFPAAQNISIGPDGQSRETIADPVLAFSWGTSLHLIRVSESKVKQITQNARTGKSSVVEIGRISFEEINKWSTDESILAMQWLNANQIVVLTESRLEIYQPPVTKPIESVPFTTLDLTSPTVFSTANERMPYADPIADIAHSMRVYKGKIFLLGRDKIQVGALLTWADHVLRFVQEGEFLQAIELTRSYYLDEAPGNRNALPDNLDMRKQLLGDKLRELMNASTQYAFSEERMRDHTHVTPEGRGVDRTSLFEDLVSTCCRACITLDDFDFLFEDLHQQYEENGILPIYLLQLEHFILNNEIRQVPPRITQRLIALHEEASRLDHVERVIWHIDPACLDINQAIHICQKHRLYDALIYIYTRALRDYVAPVVELLGMMRKLQQSRRTRMEANVHDLVSESTLEMMTLDAYKVYPYLADVLSGLTYPGEAPLPSEEALQAKKDVYTFLFFGRSGVWPHGQGAKLVLTADEEGGMEPTYPYARSLLRFDAESFLHTLDIAFEDYFLNDETQGMSRLVIIKILLEILSGGDLSPSDITFVHIFVARNVPKYPQFLQMSPNTLHNILIGLAQDSDETTREDRQLAAEFLLSAYNPHESDRIIELFQSAGFWRILQNWHRQERRWVPLLSAYINDPDLRSFDIFRNLNLVLTYATRANNGLPPPDVGEATSAVLPRLIEFDITKTATFIDSHYPHLHQKAVDLMGTNVRKKFHYLRHLLGPPESDGFDYVDSDQHTRVPSKSVTNSLQRLYIQLCCQFDRARLITDIQFIPQDQLEWNDVRNECNTHEAYDAVVWILDRHCGPQEAITQAEEYEKHLSLRIVNVLGMGCVDHDQEEKLKNDVLTLEILGRTARSICFNRSNTNWNGDLEDLWFRLLYSQVHCVQKLAGSVTPESAPLLQDALNLLRNLVQETFGALISITSLSFPKLFKRLVGSVPAAAGTPYHEVRNILTGMLEFYRSDSDMLVIAKHLVDRDVFDKIAEATRERKFGWSPIKANCHGCRKSVLVNHSTADSTAGATDKLVLYRTGMIYHNDCLPTS